MRTAGKILAGFGATVVWVLAGGIVKVLSTLLGRARRTCQPVAGGKAIRQAIEHMEQVRSVAQQIGRVAGQTNLLALNAAIQTARAGQHGMGLAVVADEVHKLAERCDQTAGQIATLIAELALRAEGGARLRIQTGEMAKQIIQATEEAVTKIAEAVATVQQPSNTKQVAPTIRGCSLTTELAAGGGETVASCREELGAQAAALRELIRQLRAG